MMSNMRFTAVEGRALSQNGRRAYPPANDAFLQKERPFMIIGRTVRAVALEKERDNRKKARRQALALPTGTWPGSPFVPPPGAFSFPHPAKRPLSAPRPSKGPQGRLTAYCNTRSHAPSISRRRASSKPLPTSPLKARDIISMRSMSQVVSRLAASFTCAFKISCFTISCWLT